MFELLFEFLAVAPLLLAACVVVWTVQALRATRRAVRHAAQHQQHFTPQQVFDPVSPVRDHARENSTPLLEPILNSTPPVPAQQHSTAAPQVVLPPVPVTPVIQPPKPLSRFWYRERPEQESGVSDESCATSEVGDGPETPRARARV